MTYSLAIRPPARADMDAAYEWYETFGAGRGERFADELYQKLVEIRDAPLRYGLVTGRIRAAKLKRSKFVIYFRVDGATVAVIAVQHARASPNKWKRRR